MGAPATWDEIVHHFLQYQGLAYRDNWGYEKWQRVNDETTIVGVPLFVDLDYMAGYLIEFEDRSTGQRNNGVIVTAPFGRGHDSRIYNGPEIGLEELSKWALPIIYGLLESLEEAWKKSHTWPCI